MAQLTDTNIEGDLTVDGMLVSKGIDLAARINNHFTKFENMFCTTHALDFTVEPGEGYTSTGTPSVYLCGNRLRIHVYCTRDTATEKGNITNEVIASVTINHGGKIQSCYNASAVNYYSSGFCTYSNSIAELTDTTLTVDIRVTATSVGSTLLRTILLLSCDLNPSAY